MDPPGFLPDWSDQPRKGKFYEGAESFPLPDTDAAARGSVQDGLCPTVSQSRPFTLPLLGAMLQDSYGLVGRRLGIHANKDLDRLPHYVTAGWSRGTASGGGLYPVSIYWVSGPGGPLGPGVFHYSSQHHAMRKLLAGDVHAEVRAALGDVAVRTDQFLVLGIKYWQNAFKYNNFSFHAVSMDVGTVIQTWRIWARALGLRVEPALWFDEQRLSELLGVAGGDEGIFAVVPLDWQGAAAPDAAGPAPAPGSPRPTSTVVVGHKDSERSRHVIRFDMLQRMHSATVGTAAQRPAPGALDSAAARWPADPGGRRHPLPPPLPLTAGVRHALRGRRSSFGRFDARRPLSAGHLATCLAATAAASLDSDATRAGAPALTKLYVFVNHVRGIDPGVFEYEPLRRTLRLLKPGAPGEFLQRTYTMANYNVEQTGAVVVPTVRVDAVLDAVGDRGYRLVNAETGALAQTFYTVAAAMELAAGVALGLDGVAYTEELSLEATGEVPLLIMMLGQERPGLADFRFEIA